MPDAGENPPSLRFSRTFKFALRETWDSLGLVCSASFTVFVAIALALIPFFVAGKSAAAGIRLLGIGLSLCLGAVLTGPIYAGTCRAAYLRLNHDEASLADVLSGYRKFGLRAAGLGLIQMMVALLEVVNAVFYAARGGMGFLVLSAFFIYALIFWGMNCLYHFPLLVAAEEGVVQREDGGQPRIRAVIRNGFLLAAGAPGYGFALLLLLAVLTVPLVISGVGFAMFLPGFAAFVTTTATRDHFVRHGLLPPPFDPDSPVDEERWRVHLE